jgi:hypothetical protein
MIPGLVRSGIDNSIQNLDYRQPFGSATGFVTSEKKNNPLKGFSLPSDYKETEAEAFEKSDAKVSDYYKPDKKAKTKFEKGDSKGFLDSVISGGLDYFDKVQGEKSDADKLIDFAKSKQKATQFGDFGAGGFKEVAQGLTYGQLPSQTQQMLIPGQQAQGKSLGQRLAGAAVGLGKGLMTGVPHGGAFGAVSGFFG